MQGHVWCDLPPGGDRAVTEARSGSRRGSRRADHRYEPDLVTGFPGQQTEAAGNARRQVGADSTQRGGTDNARNRRQGVDRGGWQSRGTTIRCRMSVCFLLLQLLAPAATWHAFSDQERMPDVPGTSVRSDVVLPQGGGIDECTAATASLRKALLVCGIGFPCDLKCAASWNSAMRDARRVIGRPCQSLEKLMNERLVEDLREFRVQEDGDFRQTEWNNLLSWCEHDAVCGKNTYYSPLVDPCSDFAGQCRDIASRTVAMECVQLTPPQTICEVFFFKRPTGQPQAACDSSRNTPCLAALTWLSFQEYQKQGLGCAGGLSDLGDEEYTTWACIHESSCSKLVDFEDYACFKYSHIRGEFHYWDLNSNLKLVPPLTQVQASFCHADGSSTLKNARNGQPVDLQHVTFLFQRELGDKSLQVYRSGFAPDLGTNACGSFLLAKRTKFRVQIDAGAGYYKWIGWMYTSDDAFTINVGLYPIITGDCSQIAFTLSWCHESVNDLDMWLFTPAEDGQIKADASHAVYWANRNITGNDDYRFNLQLDDTGGGKNGGARSFGPESLYLAGDAPPGTYAVMVQAYTNNPSSTLAGKCASVSLYSNATVGVATTNSDDTATPLISLAVGEKGKTGNWWHVLNIVVELLPGRDFKTFSYQVVDKMFDHTCRQGQGQGSCAPTVDVSGNLIGSFDPQPHVVTAQDSISILAFRTTSRTCGQLLSIGITVRDAVTNVELTYAQFSVLDKPNDVMSVGAATLVYQYEGSYLGGYQVLTGKGAVRVIASGYLTSTIEVLFQPSARYLETFLIPSDGQTRAVLSWGKEPYDLDLYVIPVNVMSFDKKPAKWSQMFGQAPSTDQEGQKPYVYYGLNEDGCNCAPYNVPCIPSCHLSAASMGGAPTYRTRLSLDRDDSDHGIPFVGDGESPTQHDYRSKGLVGNGVETVTLRNMLPGTYHVYVNAYDSQESLELRTQMFMDALAVDIYLGDGVSSTVKVDRLTRSVAGGKWFYVGFFDVFEKDKVGCNALPMSRAQVAPGTPDGVSLCVTWNTMGKLAQYPLNGNIQ